MISVPNSIKKYLDQQCERYNNQSFIDNDPISIPHQFNKKQDIEIAGFFAATFAWGQRKTIINKCQDLLRRMDMSPYDFICRHSDADLKKLIGFKHRTFNDSDLLYFISFLQQHYTHHISLEDAFTDSFSLQERNVESALNRFHSYFFSLDNIMHRTRKHVASPAQKSACKRLNMFLRWMVRKDANGVDFGLWKKIEIRQLVCPLDVHSGRVARQLGLLHRKANDWQAAIELTESLKAFDPNDPVKYDYALFGIGVNKIKSH